MPDDFEFDDRPPQSSRRTNQRGGGWFVLSLVLLGSLLVVVGLEGFEWKYRNLNVVDRELLHLGQHHRISEGDYYALQGAKTMAGLGSLLWIVGVSWALIAVAYRGMASAPLHRVTLAVALLSIIAVRLTCHIRWI